MHQDDINKDLNHYLHERKDKHFWQKFTGAPKPSDQVQEALKEDIEKKAETEEAKIEPEDKKELEQMEEKIEQTHEEEEEVQEKQEGLLKKFFKKLNFSKKDDFEDEEEPDDEPKEEHVIVEDDEELRDFLKMNHGWITKLDSDTLKEFKESKDFELYTKVLKKYGLIK